MMRKILIPLTFLGGFLTAVIISIKIIGVMNMILISKLLVLNLAIFFGKLLFVKHQNYGNPQNHYHNHYPTYPSYPPQTVHHHPHSHYGSSYPSYGVSRADSSEFERKVFTIPQSTFPHDYQPKFNKLPLRMFNPQPPPSFTPQQQYYPTSFDDHQQQFQINQPPTNIQPQLIYQRSDFGGTDIQTPQQVQAAPQPDQSQEMFYSLFNNDISNESAGMSNYIQPTAAFQKINAIERPSSSLSPSEMEKILMDALSRIDTTTSAPLVRFKRKSNHTRGISLLRPLS